MFLNKYFAANAKVITDIHPVLALAGGLLLAGGVHAVKATARPVVTATTAGVGNPLVSALEDVVAMVVSVLSVVVPILAAMIVILVLATVGWLGWQRRKRKRANTPG